MLKKMLFFVLIFLCFGFFESQEEKAINMVKDSYLNYDPSVTLGAVLDTNDLLSEQKWAYFETKRGGKVVEFRAVINSPCIIRENQLFKSFSDYREKIVNKYNVKCNIIMQFQLLKDDSFRIGYVGEIVTSDQEFINEEYFDKYKIKIVFEEGASFNNDPLKSLYQESCVVSPLWEGVTTSIMKMYEKERKNG